MKTTTEISSMYYEALLQCGFRYKMLLDERNVFLEADDELDSFIDFFIDEVKVKAPLMKMNRWLGYIQGCLIERGYIDVETERNWTRPLFRPLDYPVEG